MPEVEIIRTDIFTVGHSRLDDFGNMVITDKAGQEHKVNQKHKTLFSIFADGMAVEVGYGSYMNKEYIHTAKQVKDGLPPPQKPLPPPPSIQQQAPVYQAPVYSDTTKNRSMAFSYSKDLVTSGKIEIVDIYNCSHDIELYLKGEYTPVYSDSWFVKYATKKEVKPQPVVEEKKAKKIDPLAIPE
jgi:hypothetical protein